MKILNFEDGGRFVQAPREIYFMGLSHRARLAYDGLILYANNKTRKARPKVSTMATVMSTSADTIKRGLDELASRNVIAKQERYKDGGRLPNEYTLLHPDEWVGLEALKIAADEEVDADSYEGDTLPAHSYYPPSYQHPPSQLIATTLPAHSPIELDSIELDSIEQNSIGNKTGHVTKDETKAVDSTSSFLSAPKVNTPVETPGNNIQEQRAEGAKSFGADSNHSAPEHNAYSAPPKFVRPPSKPRKIKEAAEEEPRIAPPRFVPPSRRVAVN